MLLAEISSDVFIELSMEMLDVRDLMVLSAAAVESQLLLPTAFLEELRGARFVAKRVIDNRELVWLRTHGVKVELLAECRCISGRHHNGELEYWVHGEPLKKGP
jgi:hypothetical protein